MNIGGNIVELKAARVAGHFGEWLQGKLSPDGPIALISVQCPSFWVDVHLSDGAALPVLPETLIKRLLSEIGQDYSGPISGKMNFEPGAGLGGSTASLVALIKALGPRSLPPEEIAQIVIAVEGASDPLMYPDFDGLLWASREARIIEKLDQPPSFDMLGGTWGQPTFTDPSDQNFPVIDDLILRWKTAVTQADRTAIADISTESFVRTTRLRGDVTEPTLDLAKDLGALGVIRAHTGSARGFLFAPETVPSSGLHALSEAGYSNPVRFKTGSV